MKKIRTRLILGFMFLVLAQIACGCSINHTVAVHVYEDLNGNGIQNVGEPGFPGILVDDKANTDGSGNATVEKRNNFNCSPYWPFMDVPGDYVKKENNQYPPEWDFSTIDSIVLDGQFTGGCPAIFMNDQQSGTWTVGLQPLLTLSKNASPTRFSAAGQTITYSYIIHNSSRLSSLEQIVVTDNKTTVTCPGTTVAAGGILTCSATYVTTEQDVSNGQVVNTAQFSGVFSGTSISTSASAQATVTLEQAPASSNGQQPTTDTIAPPPPILSGTIGYCTLLNNVYYINVLFAEGADIASIQAGLADGSLQVQIAGADAACTVDASNNLMTCSFPGGTTFPTTLTVINNGVVSDTVTLDGYCPVEKPRDPNPPPPPPGGGG